MTRHAVQGSIFHMLAAPEESGTGHLFEHFEDGLLIIEDGHVAALGPRASLESRLPTGTPITVFGNALIVPGFVDTHIHYPQVDIIAAHGRQLLEWLERYTFPAEAAFADPEHAREAAAFFLDELLRNGTTTALVFGTVHKGSVDALFAEALARNMRLAAGKSMMDRHAPPELCDTAQASYDDSRALISAWHGKGRLGYAVTPRFAGTSSPEQLTLASRLLDEFPDVLLQTHLSENRAEVDWIRTLFPEAKDYLNVFERFGLVRDRSVFAHGVHLDEDAFGRLLRARAALAFCPTSNLFLGSGLFDLRTARQLNVKLGLGTDVGGGTSFSLWQTMNEAYKVGQLRDFALEPLEAFYMATLGGARALRLDDKIGNLEPGKEADFLVLDRKATPLLARRLAHCRSIEEQIFVLSILGDDRVIARTYLAGTLAHTR